MGAKGIRNPASEARSVEKEGCTAEMFPGSFTHYTAIDLRLLLLLSPFLDVIAIASLVYTLSLLV